MEKKPRKIPYENTNLTINVKILQKFIGHDDANATRPHLTEAELEDAVDKALKKADYNWDGRISWDEYVYSLGEKEVQHHMKHMKVPNV